MWTAIVRHTSGDSFILEAQDEAATTGDRRHAGISETEPVPARAAGVRNASQRVDSSARPALTGHGRRTPAGFGPQGGHHHSLAARSDSTGGGTTPAGGFTRVKRTPRFAADLQKGKRDSLGG